MQFRIVPWMLASLVSLLLLGAPLAAVAASQTVSIQNFQFVPQSVTVTVGESVTWMNLDQAVHSAKSTTGAFDSGFITTGQSRTVTFTAAGTFAYICGIHGASMSGSVTVVAPATTPAPPTPVPTPRPTPIPTPAPTPVPTIAPTPAPTAVPTPPPTASPTPSPSPTLSPTPSATPSATARATLIVVTAASPTALGAETSRIASRDVEAGPGPLLAGIAVIAVTGLGVLAFVLARRGTPY